MECMNKIAKPHKQSLVVEDQNDIWVLCLCCLVWEEFEYNDKTLIALYYGKIAKLQLFKQIKLAFVVLN